MSNEQADCCITSRYQSINLLLRRACTFKVHSFCNTVGRPHNLVSIQAYDLSMAACWLKFKLSSVYGFNVVNAFRAVPNGAKGLLLKPVRTARHDSLGL